MPGAAPGTPMPGPLPNPDAAWMPASTSPQPSAEDLIPISNFNTALQSLLRSPLRVLNQLGQPGAGRFGFWMAGIGLVCLAIYGVVVGTFSGNEQLWAAPLKITLGLFFAGLICLPSLYIFACLSGATVRLSQVMGLLLGLIALVGLLLVGLGPVGWLFGQSTESESWMGFLHLIFWTVGLGFGLRFLNLGFRRWQSTSPGVFTVWIGIFLLVVFQMSTALRPLLGRAPTLLPTEKRFFLSHWAECVQKGQ